MAAPDAGAVASVRGMLAHPVSRDELYRHSFVFPEHRLLYVETPKVACTSIKAALLALTGVTIEEVGSGLLPRPFPEAVVHERRAYPARSLVDLDDEEMEEALTSPAWIRFCVVRDPFARLFSAWESKVLLGDAGLLDRFGRLGSDDRFVGDQLDIRATFCRFVDHMYRRPEMFFEDMHFRPQARILGVGTVPYSDVVRLEDLERFLPRLGSHLGRDIDLPRLNEGLGIQWQCNYDAQAIGLVAEMYTEDVTEFGFGIPTASQQPGTHLDPIAQKLLEQVRMRVRQMGVVLAAQSPS